MPPDTEGLWEATGVLTTPVMETLIHEFSTDAANTIQDDRDLFVIHAVLLHTGKVLLFSGHTEHLYYAPVSYLFNPVTGALERKEFRQGVDLFCCHYVQLPDGKVLVVGGSQRDLVESSGAITYRGSSGGDYVQIFDPAPGVENWVPPPGNPRLLQGRWYPTAVLLGDGRVVVVSGRREAGQQADYRVYDGTLQRRAAVAGAEILSPPNYTSTLMGGNAATTALPIYPGLHLLPDGRIVYSHTNWGQEFNEPPTMAMSIAGTAAAPEGNWNSFGSAASAQPHRPRREEGMSVLLPLIPPNYEAKVLVVGGSEARIGPPSNAPILQVGGTNGFNNAAFHRAGEAGDSTSLEIMHIPAGGAPTWTTGPTLQQPRINGHCVLLPDAKVAILGGHNAFKWRATDNRAPLATHTRTTPSLRVELYTEGAATTALGAPMEHPRMYHSIALLLPDGRVLVAGGADPNENEPPLPNPISPTENRYPAGWPDARRYRPGPPGAGARRNLDPENPLNRKDYQIYQPPYFHNGARPQIESVTPSAQVQYGQTIVIRSPQASTITEGRVVLMRPGAVTHHTDSEQRYVVLTHTVSGNDITATVPLATQSSVLPPGYYMLWIVTSGATPLPCTQARWIQVVHPPPAPVAPTPATPGRRGWCPLSAIAVGTALASSLPYLQNLRSEVAGCSGAGRRLVGLVNAAYYAIGRRVTPFLRRHPRVRRAARDGFMRPAVGAIRAAEHAARKVRPRRASNALLVGLLFLEGLVTAALTPAWLLLLGLLSLRPDREPRRAW